MNIYISFEAAKFIAKNMAATAGGSVGIVNRMIETCRVRGHEFVLRDGSKIMWRKDVGWFIKTY